MAPRGVIGELGAPLIALGLSIALGLGLPGARWPARSTAAPARPSRIVSLALPADEIVLALEEFADDPRASNVLAEAREIPGRLHLSAEEILGARPDLVLVPAWADRSVLALLGHEGVPVVRVETPSSLDEVRAQIRRIGSAVGESERAETLVRQMDRRLAAARRAPDHRASVVSWSRSGYASGPGTLFCEVVLAAGGRCALSSPGLQALGIEALLALDPDVLVADDYLADGRARAVVAEPEIERDPRLASLGAVGRGQVLSLPGPHLLATSHHVAALAEDLGAALAEAGR